MVKKLIFILVLCTNVGWSQDIHFTQWMYSPLNLNPGNTGKFDGDFRVVANYRSQWAAIMEDQFKTFGMSYDQNIDVKGQMLSAGLQFVNDRSSIGKLTQNKLLLSTGYNTEIKGHYLSAGIQFGLLHKGIDWNAYSYPSQWDMDEGHFTNETLSNLESFTKSNDYMFDFNMGFNYARALNEKVFPSIGYAVYHLNKPKESFLGSNNQLTMRHVWNTNITFVVKEKYQIIPQALYMRQIKGQDLLLGLTAKMKMEENKAHINEIFAGYNFRDGFNRNYDAINYIIGARREEWQVGLSYDVNISQLSSITHFRGAFEISVIYISKNTKPSYYVVPCDIL